MLFEVFMKIKYSGLNCSDTANIIEVGNHPNIFKKNT